MFTHIIFSQKIYRNFQVFDIYSYVFFLFIILFLNCWTQVAAKLCSYGYVLVITCYLWDGGFKGLYALLLCWLFCSAMLLICKLCSKNPLKKLSAAVAVHILCVAACCASQIPQHLSELPCEEESLLWLLPIPRWAELGENLGEMRSESGYQTSIHLCPCHVSWPQNYSFLPSKCLRWSCCSSVCHMNKQTKNHEIKTIYWDTFVSMLSQK